MSTQENVAPEATVETTPTPDPAAMLAELATAYLDKKADGTPRDKVTRAQAARYRELLGDSPLETLGVSLEDAELAARKEKVLPKADNDRIRALMAELPTSHVWVKAILATAVAIEGQQADQA